MRRPRFLLGGTEVPSLGGASTSLYDLFERLQRDGHDVHLVNILDSADRAFFRYAVGDSAGNPRRLPDVADCWLSGDPVDPQPSLQAHVSAVAPDVLVGMGYYASLLFALAAPSTRNVLVTGSCASAARAITSGRSRDAIALGMDVAARALPPVPEDQGERRALHLCDLVVTHAPQTKTFMEAYYPAFTGRIYPEVVSFAEWICDGARPWRHLAKPFADRDIGVLFITTTWDRGLKNFPLVESLVPLIPDVPVHIVGVTPRRLPGAVHHGFLGSRERLFDLMGRARCVACPSLIDAAPGILFEASVLGCNVVASRNCGNWELCHPELLVDACRAGEFAASIRRAQRRKYDDGLDAFLARRGYEELVGLLDAFARCGAREVA